MLGISFLNSVLLARYWGPELFGQFSYILSFCALFLPLTAMGLNNIVSQCFIKYAKHSDHYLKSALIIRLAGALMAVIIGYVLAGSFAHSQENLTNIVIFLTMQSFCAFYLIEFYFLATHNVQATQRIRLITILIVNVVKLIAILNHVDLSLLIIIQGSEFVLIALGYLAAYRRSNQNSKRLWSVHTVKVLFHRGKWLFMSGIAAVIYLKIDQVMLANMVGNEQVAYYAAAAKLSEFWYVFPILIANAFNTQLTQLSRQNKAGYQALLHKSLQILAFIALSISVMTYFLAPYIIELLYGMAYQQSAAILSIHIFATIFVFQRAILSKWLIIEGHYHFSLISHGLGAIINLGLNMWLIPLYGGVGAAWASLIAYASASYLFLFFNAKTRAFGLVMSQAMLTSLLAPKYLKQLIK